ncbi:PIN domain-containing protein [bacterium]|nr:MAG: PIN domain-containing protein [bacterium]
MQKLLVDSGPLIALFDKRDIHHNRVLTYCRFSKERFTSSWMVVTEVSYMLSFNQHLKINFLKWIDKGGLEIIPIEHSDLERIIELSTAYIDIPIDLTDASLIVLSEKIQTRRILSIDSDFQIFRNRYKHFLLNELL